jgi:hypothetical protein
MSGIPSDQFRGRRCEGVVTPVTCHIPPPYPVLPSEPGGTTWNRAAGGLLKLTLPYAKYSSLPNLGWAKEFKPAHIRLIGVLEVSGGVGLVAPLYFHSLTMLTPLAAVGIALYMS